VIFEDGKFTFKGKTDRAKMPKRLLIRLHEIFDNQISLFLEDFPSGVCLYGEGYGVGIQKGDKYNQHREDFVLIDAKIESYWLQRDSLEKIAKKYSIDIVPVIGHGTLIEAVKICNDGFNSTWVGFQAEGIIAKPIVELFNRNGDRVITKIKCKDFDKK